MKKKVIILSVVIALIACVIAITLFFALQNDPRKPHLRTVITTTEVNGSEVNDENSVFNKIIELHPKITENDIKMTDFKAADSDNDGAATIAADEESKYVGQVGIKITRLAEKIDLSQESLMYQARVVFMNNISAQEATTIRNNVRTNIISKMNSLELTENIDYTISSNINDIKQGDHLNNYIHHISVNSVATSARATGEFTVEMQVEENISNRVVQIDIDKAEGDALSDDAARSIRNAILIRVNNILIQGQFNSIDVDYEIQNLDLLREGAQFSEYENQVIVQGISSKLTGNFRIRFILET